MRIAIATPLSSSWFCRYMSVTGFAVKVSRYLYSGFTMTIWFALPVRL